MRPKNGVMKMNRILLDTSVHQTRIALVEEGELVELIYENKKKESIVGNIYMGRVANVLPGMQAAFIDIGEEKNAYLYYGQTGMIKKELEKKNNRPKIGEEYLVQVEKAASGTKGAVVTTKLSFPGKFVVLLPFENEIGISKKIEDHEERARIKEIANELLPEDYGIIIRTEGKGKSKEDYELEVKHLLEISRAVLEKGKYSKAPAVVHKDLSAVMKASRELFSEKIDEFIVNEKEVYERLKESIKDYSGENWKKIQFYQESIPIFEAYFIESQVEKVFRNKVWLKSGGFLMIEQTEACVVIDVNTGKYTGKKDLQTTIRKTNLEAAEEIAKQLRLRNLSGMIIIDFIDMKKEEDKKELHACLEKAVSKDRIKTVVVGMTELGLMQMTRKKTKPSLWMQMTNTCQCCNGTGRVPALDNVIGEIRRKVISIFAQTIFDQVIIEADARLLAAFCGNKDEFKIGLEQAYHKEIIMKPCGQMDYGKYEINGRKKTE